MASPFSSSSSSWLVVTIFSATMAAAAAAAAVEKHFRSLDVDSNAFQEEESSVTVL